MFIQIYKQSFPLGDATSFCKICFTAFDKDKNNFIDFYEFITAIGIFIKGSLQDKLKLAFDIYDYNNDGFIERKEAQQIVQVSLLIYLLVI
jgi:Ca2+-binding EF-hand superfamily protein